MWHQLCVPRETLLCKKMVVCVGKVFLTLLLNLMVHIKIVLLYTLVLLKYCMYV